MTERCRFCRRKHVEWNSIRIEGNPNGCTYARCWNCREYASLGPSNDDPSEVAVEIRAAELADLATSDATRSESLGWHAYADGGPRTMTIADEWHAGWLGRAIHDHDEEQSS